ncbi:MAG: hypothetical protein KatS3mg002_0549 [Candidatus Woesearchaeota archaeon]|nr:MAG: hypothetical protein KatS3mg002_0549 [Candidatus Woesearchaeota archaeon]
MKCSFDYKKWIILISFIGVLFSGYLTFTKIFIGYCPINEGCAILWGYPVCVYGLIMFLIIFLSSLTFYFKKDLFNALVITKVSFIGILFSLYYSIQEIFFTNTPVKYSLGLPTCVYGLAMYGAVFMIIINSKIIKKFIFRKII